MFLISLKQSVHTQVHAPPRAGLRRVMSDDNRVDVIESWQNGFSRLPHYWHMNGPLEDFRAPGSFSEQLRVTQAELYAY